MILIKILLMGLKLITHPVWNRTNNAFSMNNRGVVISGFVSPCEGPGHGLPNNVVITVAPLTADNKNLSYYYDESSKYYRERLFNYYTPLKENKSISIGAQDIPAYQLEFNAANVERPGFQGIEIGTIVGNNLYMISYNALSATFSKDYPEFTRMVNSLEFNPVTLNVKINQSIDESKFLAKFENPYHGFQISYPLKWIKEENDGNGNIVSFTYPQIRKPGVLEISVEKLQSNDISLKKYVDNTLAAHEAMLNFRLWHMIPTTIGGLNATELVYEHAFEVDKYGPVRNMYRTLEVLVLDNGKAYSLKYTSSVYNFALHFDTVQSMFNSFSFTEFPKKIEVGYIDRSIGIEITFPNQWSGYLTKSSNKIGVTIVSGDDISSSGRTTRQHGGLKATIALLIENATSSKYEKNVSSNGTNSISCQTQSVKNTTASHFNSVEFKIGCRDGPRYTMTNGYVFQKGDKVFYLVYFADSEPVFQKHLNEFLKTVESFRIGNTEHPSPESSFRPSSIHP